MGTFSDGESGSSVRTKINAAIEKTEGTSAISTVDINGGAIDGVTLGTNSAVTDLRVDNIKVDSNEISATNTNGNVQVTPNGTGVVEVKGAGGNDGTLQLNCSVNSHGVKIKSPPHSAGASYTLVLPNNDGDASQFLQTDGSGTLSWAAAGGTGVTVHTNQAAMLTDAASASEGSLHYDTDANKLYVKQTSGFFLLATITNTTPTITSFSENTGGAGANNLTSGGTFGLTAGSNTVITINATDPDLETLVYSATVTSGTASDVISSPSLPISNQSGNTFTLVPATSGGGSITVRFDVSDGNNIANVTHSFSIQFSVTDSNFTRLLMATDNAVGGNQSITDSSSSSHTITVSNDAHAGSFSPHREGGYVSHYNTGTAYVASSSDYDIGSAFTIEFWVKADTAAQSSALLVGRENHYWFSSGYSAVGSSTGKFGFGGYFGSSWVGVAASANYVAGQWYFLRATYNGSQIEFFIDGVSQGTASASNPSTQASKPFSIGGFYSGSTHFVGKIDDLHVSSVVRSGAVPTARGVTADSNTLLIFQTSPYLKALKGSSATAQDITYTGTVISQPDSIFDNLLEYSEAAHGGSISFDGADDTLTIVGSGSAISTARSGSGFTIEGWYYPDATSASFDMIYGQSATNGYATAGALYFNGGDATLYYSISSGSSTITSSKPWVKSTWNHFAVTSTGSTLKLYINGVEGGSATDASFSGTADLQVSHTSYDLHGFVSDFRISNSVVYSSAFTPPTAPLSSTGSIVHIKGTDAHVLDKAQVSNLKLVGGAAATTTQAKFGSTASVAFDGSDDIVQTPQSSIYNLGTGAFTAECFFRVNDDDQNSLIYFLSGNTNVLGTFYFHTNNSIAVYDSGYITGNTGSGSNHNILSINTWHYLAVTRDTTTMRVYIDGTQVFSGSNTTNYSTDNIRLGGHQYGNYLNGYLQDVRISIGKARYTGSTHTVPTSSLKG